MRKTFHSSQTVPPFHLHNPSCPFHIGNHPEPLLSFSYLHPLLSFSYSVLFIFRTPFLFTFSLSLSQPFVTHLPNQPKFSYLDRNSYTVQICQWVSDNLAGRHSKGVQFHKTECEDDPRIFVRWRHVDHSHLQMATVRSVAHTIPYPLTICPI